MALREMEKRKREEYEMQLFGFHSGIVYAILKSMIREKIQSRILKLSESLEKKFEPKGDDSKQLQRNTEKLMKAYYRGAASHFSAIESCINKLISIPQHILLKEDKIQETQYTADDLTDAEENLKKVRLKIKQAIILNRALKEELQVASDFQKNIDMANKLCHVVEAESKYPEINTTMTKLMDNYKNLRRQYDDYRDMSVIRNKEISVKKIPLQFDISIL